MSPDTLDTTRSSQEQRPCWFVGAVFDGKDDQTERFIKEKIWETSKDKAKKQIQDAQPGDRRIGGSGGRAGRRRPAPPLI